MFIVALTGGIGSGKSKAANAFAALGVPIVDLDVIAHQLTAANQPLVTHIAANFGQDYVTEDGALDRNKMRQLVFDNQEALTKLNALLHPAIYDEAVKQLHSHSQSTYAILVIPLLEKDGLYTTIIDKVLVIDCDEATQIKRVKERSELETPQINKIIATQTPRYTRLAMADDVIENTGNIKELNQKINALHKIYITTDIARKKNPRPIPIDHSGPQALSKVARYEFPFNERIRTLLRLEDLFKKVLFHVKAIDEYNHHYALILLLQMLDLIERTDIKLDIVHELDRQIVCMQNLLGNPNIATDVLTKTLAETQASAAKLRTESSKIGQSLRDNEWLMGIKKRTSIPGGVCQFDLPSYHYWLNQTPEKRNNDFDIWLHQLLPMYECIKIILHILRASGIEKSYQAKQGVYEKMLTGTKPMQLLQIEVLGNCPYFPGISANKYAINVHFYNIDFNNKSTRCDDDIDFKMILCNLNVK